jgi:hypothetical protein
LQWLSSSSGRAHTITSWTWSSTKLHVCLSSFCIVIQNKNRAIHGSSWFLSISSWKGRKE